MRLYPDLMAEGTPEELAAFKHIDAALTRREERPLKALTAGPKRKRKEARTPYRAIREWAWKQGKAVASTGRIPDDVIAEYHAAHNGRQSR